MNLFYAPDLEKNATAVVLGSEESNHCLRALRHAAGQKITLTNGRGLFAEGSISSVVAGECTVDIIETRNVPARSWKLKMAVAPTKNVDRFEWFAEKATEMGIDAIFPLVCAHSERSRIPHERINRLLVAALKQSQQAWLPLLFPETDFADLINQDFDGQKFIAYCDEKSLHLKNVISKGSDILILIGPEGDFSDDEIMLAEKNGFIPISLGKNRLRTETAAMIACHTVNLIND